MDWLACGRWCGVCQAPPDQGGASSEQVVSRGRLKLVFGQLHFGYIAFRCTKMNATRLIQHEIR